MSTEEIERVLPNGLHDAIMQLYVVDYESCSLKIFLKVWVGDVTSDIEEERERYRSGILQFNGLAYFVVESPLMLGFPLEPFSVSVGDPAIDKIDSTSVLPLSPEGSFYTYLFAHKLNAFMHVCASKVEFWYNTELSANNCAEK